MNSIFISLNFVSAKEVGLSSSSPCTIASCILTQEKKVGSDYLLYSLPVRVVCWGYNAQTLACLPKDERILVHGKLWTPTSTQQGYEIETTHVILNYQGRSINEVQLVGLQGKEPETKLFSSNRQLASTSIAIKKTKDCIHWYPIQGWKKQASVLSSYGRKGEPLGVEGYVEINQWEVEGQPRQQLKINARSFQLFPTSSKKEDVKVEAEVY